MTDASLAHILYGDFPVKFDSPFSASEAAARLARATGQEAVADMPTAGKGLLAGHSTIHEVVISYGTPWWLANPFRPIFKGRFVATGGVSQLEGRLVANVILKIWLGLGAPISLVSVIVGLAVPASEVSPARAFGALAVFTVVATLLRLAMHPRSPYVRELQTAIRVAVAGEGPNNLFKPKPLRGSA